MSTEIDMIIEVERINKHFGQVPALCDVSLSVRNGEVLGIAGLNGAGKSTLISIISGVLRPDSGTVRHVGADIFKNHGHSTLTIGYVPQEIALFDGLSIRDNLGFWAAAAARRNTQKEITPKSIRIKNTLEMCALTEHSKKKVSQLSGGMKRRANIAAALVMEPDILIMDEPTAGLDSKNRRDILLFIKDLSAGYSAHQNSMENIQDPYRKQGDTPRGKPLTVLFTSHQAGEFELICDRLVLLDSGRKVYDGQIDQVNEHFSEEIKFFENSSKCNINKPTIDDILYMLGSKSDINGLPQDSIFMNDKKRA